MSVPWVGVDILHDQGQVCYISMPAFQPPPQACSIKRRISMLLLLPRMLFADESSESGREKLVVLLNCSVAKPTRSNVDERRG